MNNTKKMLAVVATYLATWLFLTIMCWILTDFTIKESSTTIGVLIIQFVLGWIPSVIVFEDLNKK